MMMMHYMFALAAQAVLGGPVELPAGAALQAAIATRDAQLFEAVFERCDPQRLRAMVTDDFEMYHDKDGVVARSGDSFVAQYAKDCVASSAPGAWRSRRELVQGSLSVFPVPGFGAIEDGEHLFYERKGNGPERLAGRGHFTHLWSKAPDGWRLSRAFSYDHRAAD